jgi:hypothetical protein
MVIEVSNNTFHHNKLTLNHGSVSLRHEIHLNSTFTCTYNASHIFHKFSCRKWSTHLAKQLTLCTISHFVLLCTCYLHTDARQR